MLGLVQKVLLNVFGNVGRHVHGAKFLPSELLQKVVGGPLDVSPYLRYLTRKYTDIYGLA